MVRGSWKSLGIKHQSLNRHSRGKLEGNYSFTIKIRLPLSMPRRIFLKKIHTSILGRFENFGILDWTVPRRAVFQKTRAVKFTFSSAVV
jgi:hypothetical protein